MDSITVGGCYLIYNQKFYGVTKSVKLSCNEKSVNFSDLTSPNSSVFQQGHLKDVAVDLTLNSTSAVELLLSNGELLQPESSVCTSSDGLELILISVKLDYGWRIPLATVKSKFCQNIKSQNSLLEIGFLAWANSSGIYAEQLSSFSSYLGYLPTVEYRTISEVEADLISFFKSYASLDDSGVYSNGVGPDHMGISVIVTEEKQATEFDYRSFVVELSIRHALHGIAINMVDKILAILPAYPDEDIVAVALLSASMPIWERPWFVGVVKLKVELKKY